jgi:hypothetical protein
LMMCAVESSFCFANTCSRAWANNSSWYILQYPFQHVHETPLRLCPFFLTDILSVSCIFGSI